MLVAIVLGHIALYRIQVGPPYTLMEVQSWSGADRYPHPLTMYRHLKTDWIAMRCNGTVYLWDADVSEGSPTPVQLLTDLIAEPGKPPLFTTYIPPLTSLCRVRNLSI